MAERLNLPTYKTRLRRTSTGLLQIFDCLRQKFVALTPEEWVRQHFVNFLINDRSFPASLMANEVGIIHNGNLRRCDTIVYDKHAHPLALIEYKAPNIAINQKVFDQIVAYNMTMGVRWLMVSNGISHYCCLVDLESGKYAFLGQIPEYSYIENQENQGIARESVN